MNSADIPILPVENEPLTLSDTLQSGGSGPGNKVVIISVATTAIIDFY